MSKIYSGDAIKSVGIGMNVATPPESGGPSVAELTAQVTAMTAMLQLTYGVRATVVVMVGFPLPDGHDRFAADIAGPCLQSRGLLAWGIRQLTEKIDDGDTSRSGKAHR